jgi:hypothetical protein
LIRFTVLPWSCSLRFPHQNSLCTPIHVTCPTHLTVLDLTTRIILGDENESRGCLLFSLLSFPLTQSVLCSDVFLKKPVFENP